MFNTLQVYMGGYYVNLFNKFGRTWQVNLHGRADGSAREADYVGTAQGPQQARPNGAAGDAGRVKSEAGPVMVMRYNMYPIGRRQRQPGAGRQLRRGDRPSMADLCDKLGLPYEWTQITYLQIAGQMGNAAALLIVFALGAVLVFLVLAAKYESWKLPLAVILVVPMCLLCSVVGMLIAQLPVDIFVQIGFLVLVGHGGEERHPDRRIRQQQREIGKSTVYDATVEACRLRLAADRDDLRSPSSSASCR